jgi:hypothetical protein
MLNRELSKAIQYAVESGDSSQAVILMNKNNVDIRNPYVLKFLIDSFRVSKSPANWAQIFLTLQDNKSELNLTRLFDTVIDILKSLEGHPNSCYLIQVALLSFPEKKQEAMLELLTSRLSFCHPLLLAIGNFPQRIQENQLQNIIPLCIKKYHAFLLSELKRIYPDAYARICSKDIDKTAQTKADGLLSITDKKAFTNYMMEFVNGFGKITYDGALLTSAQIAERKNSKKDAYTFNPTIIRENEFPAYLDILASAPKPSRERFVIAGDKHWITGDIQINSDGRVSILFIDSLGLSAQQESKDNVLIIAISTVELIKQFSRVFSDADIHFSIDKRQNIPKGCSAFALDDARHLFVVEKYLPKQYHDAGLHGYLADASKNGNAIKILDNSEDTNLFEQKFDEINVNACHIPLPFMRTMQSRDLLKNIDSPYRSQAEKSAPINKKGELASHVAKNEFSKTPYNTSLERWLEKTGRYNADFLMTTEAEKLISLMHGLSLDGFKTRVQAVKQQEPASDMTSLLSGLDWSKLTNLK